MLVIDIGIANAIVNVLVKFRIVAVPDKLTFMAVIQVFDVSRRERINTTRRRCRIPGKSRQRIHEACRRRFEVFHKRRLVLAGIRVVAATGKFRFDAPVRGGGRVDARNRVHQVRERLDGILQANVEAPEEARIRFVAKRRDFGCRALAPVKGGNAKHRTSTKAIEVERQFRTRTQEELVVDFKQRFAFKLDLDFLVRIQGAVTQKFNLAEFVVDFVVRTADKRRRTGSHLFGTRRNIHAATAIDGVARIRVAHAQHGITALAYRFKVETVCITTQVVDRKRIKLLHGSSRIQIAQRFQAVLLSKFVSFLIALRRIVIIDFPTRQPHFTRVAAGSILLEDVRIVHQWSAGRFIGKPKLLEVIARYARLVFHTENKAVRARIRNTDGIHIAEHQLVDIRKFAESRIPLDKHGLAPIMQRLSLATFFFTAVVRRNKRIAIDAVNPQDTRVAIVIILFIRDFFHAVNSL